MNEERAYSSFESYMSEHYTKEDDAHIKTFTNRIDDSNKKAKDTIIFTGLISLPEDISSLGGFGDDKTKQRICEYFFINNINLLGCSFDCFSIFILCI